MDWLLTNATWFLGAGSLLVLYVAGNRPRLAWVLGILVQPAWVYYSVVTEQWGLVVTSVVYWGVYIRNYSVERRKQAHDESVLENIRAIEDSEPAQFRTTVPKALTAEELRAAFTRKS